MGMLCLHVCMCIPGTVVAVGEDQILELELQGTTWNTGNQTWALYKSKHIF